MTPLGVNGGMVISLSRRSARDNDKPNILGDLIDMTIFGGILTYVVVWWLVLFMVLPWYVQSDLNCTIAGADKGAPKAPLLKIKFIITTIISFLLWGFFVFLFKMDIVSIQDFI
jgi:predicted secreted protein